MNSIMYNLNIGKMIARIWMNLSDNSIKRLTLCLVVFLTTNNFTYSQISDKGYPHSYYLRQLKSNVKIPALSLKNIDTKKLEVEDYENPSPFRYSYFDDVSVDIKQEGLHIELADSSGEIWLYEVTSEKAKSLQLVFKKFYVPSEATLFLYNQEYSKIYGAFTSKNNNRDSTLIIADFKGKQIIIEYFEPYNKAFEGNVVLGSIGQAYKNIFQSTLSADEDGYIGINCPEGESWQNQKHSVCLISFKIGNSGYLCSGSLINNVKVDGTPYFLTANHCISSNTEAETVVAYFNYEQTGCNGEIIDDNLTLSGATLLTTGTQSDYTLLLFNNTPPSEYRPFYSGWDASGQQGQSSIGIHHPDGKPKKISIDDSAPLSYDEPIAWENRAISPSNSHWEVDFDFGKTNTGSSGSPLFNNSRRIIGQLHGGDSEYDFYGKLSYSWINASKGYKTLKSYMDPDGTGETSIDGYYPETNFPDPQFYTEFSQVCTSAPIRLTGFSAFEPIAWDWSFSPDNITYYEGTNSFSKEPVVAFNDSGKYNVSLTASNNSGTFTNTIYEMITVGNDLKLDIFPVDLTDSCVCNFNSLILKAYGATDFTWNLQDESIPWFYLVSDIYNQVGVKRIEEIPLNTSVSILVEVEGTHGSCTGTKLYTLPLLAQENDDIENAFQITSGKTGKFSNKCASTQENEPEPPHTSCTDQKSWCDEYGTGENIVEHSVWFYFSPASDNIFSLRSEGFDNQIAIYEASSYQDILNGNYTIIGANDDYTLFNYNPYIKDFDVTNGKKYWIQIDGSGGGSEGDFYLYLENSTSSSLSDIEAFNNELKIYPQPAKEYVIVECPCFENVGAISAVVYSVSGVEVYTNSFNKPNGHTIEINTSDWDNGMYVVKFIYGGTIISTKIIK